MTLLVFNKPFGVLSQFTDEAGRPTLADYIKDRPGIYPAGRLDHDSEGLLLLTDDGRLQARIAEPAAALWKRYLAQVEREPKPTDLRTLTEGVLVEGRKTRPARTKLVSEPEWLWPRNPPIRFRKQIPTAWLEIAIHEGRNRQVRKMTAAIGHPTLRLIRVAIGDITLEGLAPGQWRELSAAEIAGFSRESASRSAQSRRHPRRDKPRS